MLARALAFLISTTGGNDRLASRSNRFTLVAECVGSVNALERMKIVCTCQESWHICSVCTGTGKEIRYAIENGKGIHFSIKLKAR